MLALVQELYTSTDDSDIRASQYDRSNLPRDLTTHQKCSPVVVRGSRPSAHIRPDDPPMPPEWLRPGEG